MKTHGLASDDIASVLGERSRVIDALDAALRATATASNAEITIGMLHTMHRVAQLLRAELQWPITASILTPAEAACMAFAEQWVIDVASMPDSLVSDLRDHLGDDGLMDYLHALLVEEQRIRLDLAWQRLGFLPSITEYEEPRARVTAAAPADIPSLRTALSEWQAAVVCLDQVDPITTELVRLRCANYHDCHT